MKKEVNLETHTKELITILDDVKKNLYQVLAGTKIAARRARVALIKLEKEGKKFRKLSMLHKKK